MNKQSGGLVSVGGLGEAVAGLAVLVVLCAVGGLAVSGALAVFGIRAGWLGGAALYLLWWLLWLPVYWVARRG